MITARKSWRVLALPALALAASAVVGAPREELVAAVPADFPPYYRVNSDGKPAGHAIDVMDHLAEMAQVKVRYVISPDWEGAMEALRQGEADLIPNLGITPERAGEFEFTAPLETLALGIFVRSATLDIHGIDGLSGKRVAVVKRNAAIRWLQSYPTVKGKEFETQEQALFALLSGDVDGLVYPIDVTWKIASAIGVDGRIRQAGLPVLEIKRAVAVRKGNQALLDRLDEAVRNYTRSAQFGGAYARLHSSPPPFWTPERLFRYASGVAVAVFGLIALALLWWRRHSVAALSQAVDACRESLRRCTRELEETKERMEQAETAASRRAGEGPVKPD